MLAKYAVIPDKERCEIRAERIDPDALQPDQILVRARYSVVSAGTELAGYYALSPRVYQKGSWNAYPWRPGYGLIGEVLAAGCDIVDYPPGRRVFCFGKHASLQIYTVDIQNTNPAQAIFAAPDYLNDKQVAAARMGLVAITAPQVSGTQKGGSVAVFGLGMVGNLAAQLYQDAGMRVIGLDPVGRRQEIAKHCGIREIIGDPPEQQVSALQELTNRLGVDIAVDAVGHSEVIRSCVESVVTGGKVVLLGSPREEVQSDLTAVFRPVHLKCIQILGAFEWRLPAHPREGRSGSIQQNLEHLWEQIGAGKVQVDALITHILPPEELDTAYQGLMHNKEEYLGVLVDWSA